MKLKKKEATPKKSMKKKNVVTVVALNGPVNYISGTRHIIEYNVQFEARWKHFHPLKRFCSFLFLFFFKYCKIKKKKTKERKKKWNLPLADIQTPHRHIHTHRCIDLVFFFHFKHWHWSYMYYSMCELYLNHNRNLILNSNLHSKWFISLML